jgi:hypothetical protein
MRKPDRPLKVALQWVVNHCVVPDGVRRGQPFRPTNEQVIFLANHYDVRPDPHPEALGSAFVHRRSQLVRPQKWGKSPLTAAQVCLEAVGPALFAGFADGGEEYWCSDHGCGCGWAYRYSTGEPMGRQWSTPLIQVTATSEEQTDNVYAALRPMIELGALADVIPKTGEEFIRLPNGGRIDTVTSNARSRLGQRVTFVPQDETGIWTPTSGMVKVAETQRRGLAGMDGRACEYTNAWDPSEQSVAQRTFESMAQDVHRDYLKPPGNLSYRNKAERRKIHRVVYGESLRDRGGWVTLDAIEAEASEIVERDPAQAERFFGNRTVAGSDAFLEEPDFWDRQASKVNPTSGRITVGFDGSMYDDWTVIRARLWTPEGWVGFTPQFADGKPMVWNPTEHGGEVPRHEVNAAVEHLFATFDVIRMYCDPELWQSEIDAWAAKYGEKRVVSWATYRIVQMSQALERWKTDLAARSFTHDGCETTALHVKNARKVRRGSHIAVGKPTEHQKIDAMVSDVLAHEAAGDVTAAGQAEPKRRRYAATA